MAINIKNEIDADSIAAEVVMLRAASEKAIMLVEGGDDEKVFSEFIDDSNCEIVICYGQENALGANGILESRNIKGVLCVIDSDFSTFIGSRATSENIVYTDDHDIEVMLFRSRAFDRVVSELGSGPKIKKLRDAGLDPREPIWKSARYLGILRLCSIDFRLNLKFEDVKFTFVDRKTLEVNVEAMIKTVFDNSRKAVERKDDIIKFITDWLGRRHDHWHMCCGHDVCEIFGRALQSVIGNQTAAKTARDDIEAALRLGYTYEFFSKTLMYKSIRQWEAKNTSFFCLRTPEP